LKSKRQHTHNFIITNAEDIAGFYISGHSKTETAKWYGISIGGVDRALFTTGHSNLCSKWFVSMANKTYTPANPRGKVKQEEVEKIDIPQFEEMTNFLIDVIAKAEKVFSLEKENKQLKDTINVMQSTITELKEKNSSITGAKLRWELLSRDGGVTHGD